WSRARGRGRALFTFDGRTELVGGHPEAAVPERHALPVHADLLGEAAVEGLALATLVVELARDGRIHGEEARYDHGHRQSATQRFAPRGPPRRAQLRQPRR